MEVEGWRITQGYKTTWEDAASSPLEKGAPNQAHIFFKEETTKNEDLDSSHRRISTLQNSSPKNAAATNSNSTMRKTGEYNELRGSTETKSPKLATKKIHIT